MEIDMLILEEEGVVYNIKHSAYYFSRDIVLFIGKQQFDKIYFSIFDQLLRSATSIGGNLVEGMAGASIKVFFEILYYSIKIS